MTFTRFYRYLPVLFWTLLIWQLTTTPKPPTLDTDWLNALMMISGHFIFFGIQAILFYWSNSTLFNFLRSISFVSLYGAFIEYYQHYIPGRSADIKDFLLDVLGAFSFLYLFTKLKSKL